MLRSLSLLLLLSSLATQSVWANKEDLYDQEANGSSTLAARDMGPPATEFPRAANGRGQHALSSPEVPGRVVGVPHLQFSVHQTPLVSGLARKLHPPRRCLQHTGRIASAALGEAELAQ